MPPTFVVDEPINVPINGHLKLMWRCVCSVEDYGSFPREKHGVETGKQPPSFQSKKVRCVEHSVLSFTPLTITQNAKRYAAKHALQYMKDFPHTGNILADPPNKRAAAVLSPSPARMSPAHKMKREDSPRRPSQTLASPAPDSRPSSRGPDGDEAASVLKQISALAERLGIDNPSYRLEEDDEMPNFFSGRPVFKPGGRVPRDLGVVSGVLGKRHAKMQVAERVLEWLQGEEQRGDEFVESLWKNGA